MFAVKAEKTAPDVHHAIFSPVKGRKSQGFYQFAIIQLGAADRAGMGRTGITVTRDFRDFLFPDTPGYRDSHAEKQGITEPEQYYGGNHQKKYLEILSHIMISALIIIKVGVKSADPDNNREIPEKHLTFGVKG